MELKMWATFGLFILSIVLIVLAVYVASDKETIVKQCNAHYYYEMAKCNCFDLTNFTLTGYNFSVSDK
jgi:hypothetical protein